MANKLLRSLSIMLVFLAGCSHSGSSPQVTLAPASINTEKPRDNIPELGVPKITPKPTETAPLPTRAATPQQSRVPAKINTTLGECSNPGTPSSSPNKITFPGTIVYQKGNLGDVYLVGGNPLAWSKILPSPNGHTVILGFSPNGEWLALSSPPINNENDLPAYKSNPLTLLSYRGEQRENNIDLAPILQQISPDNRIVGFLPSSFWINDDLLDINISIGSQDPTSSQHSSILGTVFQPSRNVVRNDLINNLPEYFPQHELGFLQIYRGHYMLKSLATFWVASY